MINLIIPPIIIILVIALLITILARAVKSMPDHESEILHGKQKKPEKKTTKKLRSNFLRFSGTVKRAAHRRQKKAITQEKSMDAQMNVQSEIPHEEVNHQAVQPDAASQHKLSRMGELILSYHRGGADEDAPDDGRDSQEAYFVKKIEANPKDLNAYQQLGDYYMEMHKFEDARESYKYVLRLDPRHRKAQEAMKNLDRVLG